MTTDRTLGEHFRDFYSSLEKEDNATKDFSIHAISNGLSRYPHLFIENISNKELKNNQVVVAVEDNYPSSNITPLLNRFSRLTPLQIFVFYQLSGMHKVVIRGVVTEESHVYRNLPTKKGIGLCYVSYDNRIVVQRRDNYTQTYPNTYAIPSGRQFPLESEKQGAIREFKEETGVTISPERLYLLAEEHLFYNNSYFKKTFYGTTGEQDTFKSNEGSFIRLTDIQTLPENEIVPFHKIIMHLALVQAKSWV